VIELAFAALDAHFGLLRRSAHYPFPAWPNPADPPFVNAAAILRPGPDPAALMAGLHAIEAAFGRRRERKNTPRTLDLDLLAYGDLIQQGPPTLPHPGLADRDFVLAPLAEIASEFRSPRTGLTVAEMLAQVTG
jgi:2-amino-4-hydroxy-6-hydroxymethyldihydropteridine diphosphokinase